MTRAVAPALAVLVLSGCGSEPLTAAEFRREARRACDAVAAAPRAAPADVHRAHREARRRIQALAVDPDAKRDAAPVLERLEGQGRRLEQLVRAEADGARPARLAELAGALELDRRLAGEGPLREAVDRCLAAPAQLTERYALRAYAVRARPMLRRATRFVEDPGWDSLRSGDPRIVRDTALELSHTFYTGTPDEFFDSEPPRAVRREHRAVDRALAAMIDAAWNAKDLLETTGGTLAGARRHLRRFFAARRDFRRARARLLRALG